ncbi:hypothetical protein A2V80_02325 [Candidatus Woesebacteria bacterium RBG_16_39_8b]|uniref:Uncharacterized protein n=1 Tax=Candidatus Woesebacteria bacterium RBG_16_39_8b TaxID=1802482 RepID=A0A1F7XAM7_9BACT|nr:MAG: hypothetical protein A2V80_02325 [Candidatus Woesebacteria bacterium RBG_16_39_8b]
MRLYAFTLSSQLYTYYRQARPYLESLVGRGMLWEGMNLDEVEILPYLTVPVENEKILRWVVSIFKKIRLIRED